MTESEMNYNKNISRLISYIGFAKKARNIYFGADKVLASKKKGVIIVSRNISGGTLNKLNNHALKTNSEVMIIPENIMEEIVQSDKIKVFLILEANLEKAVVTGLKSLEDTILE